VTEPPAWHQALAYAFTGRRFEELGRQAAPDLALLTAFLASRLTGDGDQVVASRPHRVPADLATGLGPAQLWAAAAELRRRLAGATPPAGVTRERPLTAEERRLLEDVPPHHGA